MELIICEKPRVAERIASALAEGSIRRERLFGVAHFSLTRRGKEIVVAPAVGHLYSLKEAKATRGYPSFDIEWAPSYSVNKGAAFTKAYVQALAALGKKADSVISACDYDIEGSLIAYNAMRFACGKESGRRMKFSTLTPQELVDAYENMGELDYGNIFAGEARHMVDWMWGINLSRALMSALRSAGKPRVMSIGRVQGPALKLLAKRESEIMNFKPVPYWQIAAVCKGANFLHTKGKFWKKEEAEAALKNSKKEGTVKKVEKNDVKVPPLPPFDLTALQIEAYGCFGISPSQTLELAQSLYENSLISYPRTSSQKLPAKLNLPRVLNELSKNPKYEALAKKLIAGNKFRPREGKKEDPAHPAIHPTGARPGALAANEEKIYDLIAKRFLSCFADWMSREDSEVRILFGTEEYSATGSRVIEMGWAGFYSPYFTFKYTPLPQFAEGEKVKAEKFSLSEKKTEAPRRYSQASIIQLLESKGLGTKATRSVIIDTLFKRKYISSRALKVTSFGLSVSNVLDKNCKEIVDEKLTRELEEKMDGIITGKTTEKEVITEAKAMIMNIASKFKLREKEIGAEIGMALAETEREETYSGKCKLCGDELRKIRTRSGSVFVGCSGYPKCRQTYPLPQNAAIRFLKKTCKKCGTVMISVSRKGKGRFEMCIDPACETKKGWGKKNSGEETTLFGASSLTPFA